MFLRLVPKPACIYCYMPVAKDGTGWFPSDVAALKLLVPSLDLIGRITSLNMVS